MDKKPSYAICFLSINEMGELAKTSINSALNVTDCPIYIGTDSVSNIKRHFDNTRIHVFELALEENFSTKTLGNYQDFNSNIFYEIVQYKWKLLLEMLEKDFEYIIFSDTDVFWNQNPIFDLVSGFSKDSTKEMLIQDASLKADDIRLCMGFVIFRNSDVAKSIIREAHSLHLEMSKSRAKLGDDDVISAMYKNPETQRLIGRLPQISYPVGIFLNLYATQNRMPGLSPTQPFLFHANFTIGLRRKYLLMKLFISGKGLKSIAKLPFELHLFNQYLRLRLFIGKARRRSFRDRA